MSDRESNVRAAITLYFPMFIAALSLITAIFNGYLNSRFVDLVQNNIARVEYLRTCKDVIDAYFQVKFRAGLIALAAQSGANAGNPMRPEQIEGHNATSKFGALGTYLANLRNDTVRAEYTKLYEEVDKIVSDAARKSPTEVEKMFEPADGRFTEMNNDCVRSAKAASFN